MINSARMIPMQNRPLSPHRPGANSAGIVDHPNRPSARVVPPDRGRGQPVRSRARHPEGVCSAMPSRRVKDQPGRVRETLSGWEWECARTRCGLGGRYFGSEFCAANLLTEHEGRTHGTVWSSALVPVSAPFLDWTETVPIAEGLSDVWGAEFDALDEALLYAVVLDTLHMINSEQWGSVRAAAREHQRRIRPGNLAGYADLCRDDYGS